MRNRERQILRYFMLLTGMVLLLSVVLPHHHHRDGKACYIPFLTEEAAGNHDSDPHNCSCNGHNLAFFKTYHSSSSQSNDLDLHPMPVAFLFDWVCSLTIGRWKDSPHRERPLYIESLHGVWITDATGLRAPPVVL